MGVKIDFRFRTEDGDTAGRRGMVADVAGQCRRCIKSHIRFRSDQSACSLKPTRSRPGRQRPVRKTPKAPRPASAESLPRQRASGPHQQRHCRKHQDEIMREKIKAESDRNKRGSQQAAHKTLGPTRNGTVGTEKEKTRRGQAPEKIVRPVITENFWRDLGRCTATNARRRKRPSIARNF